MTARTPKLDTPDHRELWRMLARLDPARRVWFIGWCCERATARGSLPVRITTHTGTVAEAYQDLLSLDNAYGVSLAEMRQWLDEFLRRA